MTLDAALEIVIRLTGHPRFRALCAESNPDVEQRDGYRRLVLEMATGQPAAPPEDSTIPLAESLRLTKLAWRCPYRSAPACGCAGAAACALKGGVDVPTATCWDCVRRFPADLIDPIQSII